jgi:hypothetical protein
MVRGYCSDGPGSNRSSEFRAWYELAIEHNPSAAHARSLMAVERTDAPQRIPIPRAGQIRRCSVRHVAITPVPGGRAVDVTCLLGGPDHPLPLGTFAEARPICNACTARGIWRADED